MKLEKRFPEKRVMITGGGSGLGKALALGFARRGWRVAVAEVVRKRAEETAGELKALGAGAMAIPCDVTRQKDLDAAARRLRKEWGGLDILVNNAGVAGAGPVATTPPAQWDWIIGINLTGIINGCRAFIPMMEGQGRGYIVNVASCAGIASFPEMGCYNVTKAAAISLSETLRGELSGKGIGVSAVCPTFFKTNLMDRFESPDERQRAMARQFFEKSRYTADDIARHTLRSIEKNRFYIITQTDGKFIWWFKRRFPELYLRIIARYYRKGTMERYLGVNTEDNADKGRKK